MGLGVTAIGVLLIACISVGDSLSLEPLCMTLNPCSSASDCPTFLPVCDNGKCCFKWPIKPQMKKTCPQTPFGVGIICPAVYLDDECSNDQECPTGKKCCFVGCGPRKCHDAVVTPFGLDLSTKN